ncbi:MAG: DNA replication/repair protein RecF [Bacteroidia bacterium]|nr:DNA replication/repair protein RecF [Bacteroidia bacterium]
MYIKKVHLVNFKNYPEAELAFSPKINCFTGSNGAGKTNILDAIYYLSYCKSYFNATDQQNIRHDQDFFAVHGSFSSEGNPDDRVSCMLSRGQKKQFSLNKKEYQRLADHIGKFPLVMISPYDQDLINNGSEVRRKYFDSVISQFDSVYLDTLINYNRALFQRNTLLKKYAETGTFNVEALEIWDEQLVEHAGLLFESRCAFANAFIPMLQHFYTLVSKGRETVSVEYLSHLHSRGPRELLFDSVMKDRMLKYTTTGIHKDDYSFLLDGHPVKRFGSQGQQKSFYIATKLAQFEYTRIQKGYKPILLLDDIFDKLDDGRVSAIVKLVSDNMFGQVFITDTHSERIERLVSQIHTEYAHYIVTNATVKRNGFTK